MNFAFANLSTIKLLETKKKLVSIYNDKGERLFEGFLKLKPEIDSEEFWREIARDPMEVWTLGDLPFDFSALPEGIDLEDTALYNTAYASQPKLADCIINEGNNLFSFRHLAHFHYQIYLSHSIVEQYNWTLSRSPTLIRRNHYAVQISKRDNHSVFTFDGDTFPPYLMAIQSKGIIPIGDTENPLKNQAAFAEGLKLLFANYDRHYYKYFAAKYRRFIPKPTREFMEKIYAFMEESLFADEVELAKRLPPVTLKRLSENQFKKLIEVEKTLLPEGMTFKHTVQESDTTCSALKAFYILRHFLGFTTEQIHEFLSLKDLGFNRKVFTKIYNAKSPRYFNSYYILATILKYTVKNKDHAARIFLDISEKYIDRTLDKYGYTQYKSEMNWSDCPISFNLSYPLAISTFLDFTNEDLFKTSYIEKVLNNSYVALIDFLAGISGNRSKANAARWGISATGFTTDLIVDSIKQINGIHAVYKVEKVRLKYPKFQDIYDQEELRYYQRNPRTQKSPTIRDFHDILSRVYNEMNLEDIPFLHLDKYRFLEHEIDGVRFKLAESTGELRKVGNALGICVGGYDKKALAEDCVIVVGEQDGEELYCLEYIPKGERLAQFKLSYNRRPVWHEDKTHMQRAKDYVSAAKIKHTCHDINNIAWVELDINIKTNEMRAV